MKKDIVRYAFISLGLILILGLVYPTMYRYDKYDQKIPVRINRITGNADLLSANGWEPAKETSPSKTEMQIFKEQMDIRFDGIKKEIENDVSNKLTKDVMGNIQNKLNDVEKEIGAYKLAQLDPNGSFTTGSTMEEVKKIMGVPSKIYDILDERTWLYGSSAVVFKNNKVITWDNRSDNLKLK